MNRRSMERKLRSNQRNGLLPPSTPNLPKKKMRLSSNANIVSDAQPTEQDKEPSKQIEEPTVPVNVDLDESNLPS